MQLLLPIPVKLRVTKKRARGIKKLEINTIALGENYVCSPSVTTINENSTMYFVKDSLILNVVPF